MNRTFQKTSPSLQACRVVFVLRCFTKASCKLAGVCLALTGMGGKSGLEGQPVTYHGVGPPMGSTPTSVIIIIIVIITIIIIIVIIINIIIFSLDTLFELKICVDLDVVSCSPLLVYRGTSGVQKLSKGQSLRLRALLTPPNQMKHRQLAARGTFVSSLVAKK